MSYKITDAEHAEMRARCHAGQTPDEIAKAMSRDRSAVTRYLKSIGLGSPPGKRPEATRVPFRKTPLPAPNAVPGITLQQLMGGR